MNKGEALRLSSIKAATAVKSGVLIEKNASGLLDVLNTTEARALLLMDRLQLPPENANKDAMRLATSLLIRHESLKSFRPPSPQFMAEVVEFNLIAKGPNPISKIPSKTGAGEWGGFRCNIGSGCSYGCPGCYAEGMADRFNRIESSDEWLVEELRDASTAKCRKYSDWIMFPTTHDISANYLPAYRCHLYNILKAGNSVLMVTKPRRESIEAICSEFSSFRDKMIFRFTIGGLNNDALRVWNPGAPDLQERLWCLRYAFEQGFRTSISSEPILVSCQDAEHLYYAVEPLVTEDIWFGKMSGIGGFKKHSDPEVARRAAELMLAYKDDSIMQFVRNMAGLPKVQWKDSIKAVIKKYSGDSVANGN